MSVTTIRTGILIFVLYNSFQYINAADQTDISRLRAFLLTNYDNHSRPIQNVKNSTIVEASFINHGFEFDATKGILTLHCETILYWQDQHIKWDPLNYGNLTNLKFFPTELWRPDIMVYNNIDKSEIDHFSNTLIVAINDSRIYWFPPSKFQVRCETDFLRWPYDMHVCYIIIGSWAHDGTEIELTLAENHTELSAEVDVWGVIPTENKEWKLLRNSVERRVQEFNCCPGTPFIDIVISMSIARRASSHTAAITVVAIGIAAAILISFWLDPFAKERVPVILTAIFLNAVYLSLIYRTIPYNGPNVPYAICFFRDSLMMVTVALAWTVIIRYIAKTKRNSPVPLPDFVQKFLESVLAKILCVNPRPSLIGNKNAVPSRNEEFDDNDELVKNDNVYAEDWAWLAHLLDRLAFFIYLIVYSVFIIIFY